MEDNKGSIIMLIIVFLGIVLSLSIDGYLDVQEDKQPAIEITHPNG